MPGSGTQGSDLTQRVGAADDASGLDPFAASLPPLRRFLHAALQRRLWRALWERRRDSSTGSTSKPCAPWRVDSKPDLAAALCCGHAAKTLFHMLWRCLRREPLRTAAGLTPAGLLRWDWPRPGCAP